MRIRTVVLFVLICCSLTNPIQAALFAPQVFPAQSNVAADRAARIHATWQLTTDTGPTVISTVGVLEDASGNVYHTRMRSLSVSAPKAGMPLPGGNLSQQTVRLRESFTVPAAALARALQNGTTRLFYRRVFSDGSGATATILLPVNITGAGAAGFAVNYIGLRFDDDNVRRLVEPGATLRARAEVRFSGNGQLQGIWEIADPSSTHGTPIFWPLRQVRQALFGGRAERIESPPLPTGRSGLYLLRLRVTEPATEEIPVLHYYVSRDAEPALQPVRLLAPPPGTRATAKTLFRWRPLVGTHAYRVEIHAISDAEDAPPRTGLLVDGETTATTLGAPAWRHIAEGQRYRWRVIAIGAQGKRIGASEARPLLAAEEAP